MGDVWRRLRRDHGAVYQRVFAAARATAAPNDGHRTYARLFSLLAHAGESVPFHGERMRAAGLDPRHPHTPLRLRRLPVLERIELSDRLLSRRFRRGELVEEAGVWHWPEALVQRRAAEHVARRRAGWPEPARIAGIGLPGRAPPASWTARARARLVGGAYTLAAPAFSKTALARLAREVRALGPDVLLGDARSLDLLARHLLWRGRRADVPLVVLPAAETGNDLRRDAARAFRGEVRTALAIPECGLLALECARGALHANTVAVHLETHEDGRLLVTDLLNRAMPLLRFDTGLLGVVADGPCPCGDRRPVVWDVRRAP